MWHRFCISLRLGGAKSQTRGCQEQIHWKPGTQLPYGEDIRMRVWPFMWSYAWALHGSFNWPVTETRIYGYQGATKCHKQQSMPSVSTSSNKPRGWRISVVPRMFQDCSTTFTCQVKRFCPSLRTSLTRGGWCLELLNNSPWALLSERCSVDLQTASSSKTSFFYFHWFCFAKWVRSN